MTEKELVLLFADGDAGARELLGGKGANLAEMTRIGLPVPPGLTITTIACRRFYEEGRRLPEGLAEQLAEKLSVVEKQTGKSFGDAQNPLLVSVRSGAAVSMPGMMDTILNLGLNDETVQGLAANANDERFALDCFRRFIQMFGNVVLKIPHARFEELLAQKRVAVGAQYDYEIKSATLAELIEDYKKLVLQETGVSFPQDPHEQLLMAVHAVLASWQNERAIVYRRIHHIPDDLGTAVNVQAMVFGNLGADCGTGVLFTRNPNTGEAVLYGEYLINAQGEDVVAGIRTPKPIAQLAMEMPDVWAELQAACRLLESHYKEMQDIEFTVEKGRLYILQTRSGKRTAQAAVRIAIEMVDEGLIDRREALRRVDPEQLVQLLHRQVDPQTDSDVVAVGLPASPGAASGQVAFSADEAERLGEAGEKVILVRPETTPDDIHGIVQAQGVLTSRGGMTCHAAIVARGMGKPAVVGCEALEIDLVNGTLRVGERLYRQGDLISIDGTTGRVFDGLVETIEPKLGAEFARLLSWADEEARLEVYANADTPADAEAARRFGAVGIGLCRTEHMFMAQDRLPVVQDMILAANEEERQAALDKLLPMQQGDFEGILRAMAGYPVIIRLLDPPLHEFLPDEMELHKSVWELEKAGDRTALAEKQALLTKVQRMQEANPMMGHRGCRVGIISPEIYEMQARAIFQAVAKLVGEEGLTIKPEVMIPLVGHYRELEATRQVVVRAAKDVQAQTGVKFSYKVGTMIEVPRAALTADEIATYAEFFSFGTNDLTQMTFGFSRDDAEGKFLTHYLMNKILPANPFAELDRNGVGKLMQMALELGRATRPDLSIGICGEHGGDPSSIQFCHEIGLDYVSCSPFRVPVARLAAAQVAISSPR
ncbi:MAG TPA: pyruvate, phosphate dikinase [Firmicutes bacterium]|nr:pyruvate, phosphate dikinase [Bacillota bacterium]